MKQTVFFMAISIILLLSSGCTPSNESDPPSAETTNNLSITTNNTEVTVNNTEVTTNNVKYEIFKGLPKAENTINTVNCKEFRPSLLCYGDGNTFFMWDGTVYKHSKDTTEPLFDKNAYNLNYNNGKLYFIENDDFDINSDSRLHIEGFVYCYDLESDKLEQLTDFPVSQLFVTDKGIFYTDYATMKDPEPPTGVYQIDEKTGQSEKLYNSFNYIEYGDYRLKYIQESDGRIAVVFFNGDEEYFLNYDHSMWECINGDYYYFCSSSSDNFLNRLSMLTGEITSLKPYESTAVQLNEEANYSYICLDYTVLNDVIYFIDDSFSLRRYDEKTDSCTPIDCNYVFEYIFADDENIYGVGFDVTVPAQTYHFVKLTMNGDKTEGEILA